MPSTSFYHTELQRALREQSFGIKNFAITSSSSDQATATVVLLEGSNLNVRLTTQGYSADGSRVHEAIEGLLQSSSALYAKKHQDVLVAKLANLS